QREPYGRPIYRFVQADDLRQVGRMVTPFIADSRGNVAITGSIVKHRTSDDVQIRIFKQDITRATSTTILSLDVPANQEATIPTVVPDVPVESQDVLSFEVLSDVPIDPNLVTWD